MEEVILVNEQDEQTGSMEKMQAHREGKLHRAFSVFIFNNKGEMLLQQRALNKYHSGGLWTNACCSHPRPNELTEAAAIRRLKEELGFDTDIKEIFSFTYHAAVENGLTEYEYDHVFAGIYEGAIEANKNEVAAFRYEEMEDVKLAMQEQPQTFTVWFKIVFPKIEKWWQGQFKIHS